MATTTPDNIQYPVNSDQVAPLASHFKNVADSTHAALNNKASNASVAAKVAKAGDTMTGALVLSGDPTLALHATTKQYVDAADTALQTAVNDIKQTSRVYVKNGSTALTKGTPVYITGADGTNIIIGAAGNGSEATSSKTIGLLETDLAINAMGYVVTDGKLSNIDTSGATAAGDAVWLGPSGTKVYGLSNKPVAPAHMVYLGVVSRKNANTGEIQVKVQNGFELDELHNVQINSGTLATGQALTYDGSSQLWKNATPVSSLSGLSDVTLGTLSPNEVLKYNGTKWVNGVAAGGVTAAATAPDISAAKQGDAWFDTNDGTLYVCYIDADSTKQWVQVQANSALEASILSRVGALEASNIAAGTTSPNYIINGGFDFWQRGTSTTSSGYLADRFTFAGVSGFTQSRQSFTPGSAPVTGYEGQYYWNVTMTSSNQNGEFLQRVEDARTLAGQTVTLSFWARSTAGAQALNCNIYQHFGTGGSPSSLVQATGGGTYTPTSSWQRYTFTFTMPSVAGKTFGTNNDSFLWVRVGQFTATTTNTSLDIWGVQLERGNTATSFRRNAPSIQGEFAACQRYYQRWTSIGAYTPIIGTGFATASTGARIHVPLLTSMRTSPAAIESANFGIYNVTSVYGISSMSIVGTYGNAFVVDVITSSLSAGQAVLAYATGGGSGYLGVSAEL